MNRTAVLSKRVCFIFVLLVMLLNACSPAVKTPLATDTPAATATSAPTDTPEPTSTFTPTATATSTETPKPTATATPNRTATVRAEATAEAEALLTKIEPNLKTYGYTLADGHLIWSRQDAMEITVKEYGMSRFVPLKAPAGDDFIIQTSITWNTTGGLAGCGLFFRMDEAEDGRSNQFEMWRLQNAPAWNISFYDKGAWQRSLSNWVYSNVIEDKNDDTNIVALVVSGRNIYPFINGKKQRLVEDITLKDGLFAISATQDSGVSTCTFEDTWIWQIDKKK